jgi:tyrosyl-tRNA synthetase
MDEIEQLLKRGVDKIYPSYEELDKVLRSGKKLKLYQGFDPTGTDLHIGHMIGLRKLSQWQKLGHHVIFLIGTGTGQAGDPTGKLTSREKFFSEEELKQNAKDYVMQAKKLLNFEGENAVEILYNGDWLNKLSLSDILDIAGHFTVQQLIERDMFQKRLKDNAPINLREFLYPLLQGYDSVAMEVDLELGGSDQTFNMLVGRQLLKSMKGKGKFVMTIPLLEDSQGRKIGKSEGNVISITDKAEDLYGKIMSLSDDVVVKAMEYLTDIPLDKIKETEEKIKNGENPITYKKQLAFEIVKQLNSEKDAELAQETFQSVVQNKEVPKDIEELTVPNGHSLSKIVIEKGLVDSMSEWKRLVEQHGVSFNEIKIETPFYNTNDLPDGVVLKIGKRKYAKIKKV